MDKLTPQDGQSLNIVADNIERLREIFPTAFAEGRVDFEALKQCLGECLDERTERYSFTWHGKRCARRIAQTPSAATLLPCPDESLNWDSTQNIFIEGDNLEVLKLLQKSYHRKVKMIYIDPPYNTGKEFIYPDNYQDNLSTYLKYTGQIDGEGCKLSPNTESGGRYHTNWLNMMYPRLILARNLLRDDGVMFVSIDEHEVHNLRYLMDEVYGPEHQLAAIAVSMNPKGRQLAPFFATSHEYILIYARNIEECCLVPATTAAVNPENFPLVDPRGCYRLLPLRNTNKKFNPITRRNLAYPLYIDPDNGAVYTNQQAGTITVLPVFGSGAPAVWRWGKTKTSNQQADLFGRKVSGRNGERWDIFQKDYNFPGRKAKLTSLWLSKDIGSTDAAAEELKAYNLPLFDTPKPSALIKRLCSLMPPDSLVLDFFAGSGTTGDAVIQLNTEPNRSQRYILVQLPHLLDATTQRTIADLTKKRLIAAVDSCSTTLDPGFKVFKLSSSNIKPWDPDCDAVDGALLDAAIDNIKPDRSQLAVLYELLLKYGLDLASVIEIRTIADRCVFIVANGALVVCLERGIRLEVVRGIAALKTELQPPLMRVVFRDSCFDNDVLKTNALQILTQAGIPHVKSL